MKRRISPQLYKTSLMHRVALDNSQEELIIHNNPCIYFWMLIATLDFCLEHFQRAVFYRNIQGDKYREFEKELC